MTSFSLDVGGIPVRRVHLDSGLSGRGMSVLALMEVSARVGATLILLLPDLVPQPDGADILGKGFAPHWVSRLYDATANNRIDLALARFNRHPLECPVETLVVYPLISGIFGFRIRQPMPGVLALSYQLMRSCLDNLKQFPLECTMLGFDPWLTCHAFMERFSIGEVCLGLASVSHDRGKLKQLFRQATAGLLTVVTENQKRWLTRPNPIQQPKVIGPIPHEVPPEMKLERDDLLRHFKSEFDHFDYTLFYHLIPDDTRKQMEQWADSGADNFGLTRPKWNDILQRFSIAFAFPEIAHPGDTVDGLFPLFLARFLHLVGYNQDTEASIRPFEDRDGLNFKAHRALTERELHLQADAFINAWPTFQETWKGHRQARGSYLPRLGAWEFVPNVDIVVPQELKKTDGTSVWAYEVYQEILQDRRADFRRFLSDDLEVEDISDAESVLSSVRGFMTRLDETLSKSLFPHDLKTAAGVRNMTDDCIREFSDGNCFQLTPDAARYIILKATPRNLSVYLKASSAFQLLNAFAPNDLLAMAAWTDRRSYLDRVLDLILQEGSPDWFHTAPLASAPLNLESLESFDEVRAETFLLRMAGRLTAASYPQPQTSNLSMLWFLLKTV